MSIFLFIVIIIIILVFFINEFVISRLQLNVSTEKFKDDEIQVLSQEKSPGSGQDKENTEVVSEVSNSNDIKSPNRSKRRCSPVQDDQPKRQKLQESHSEKLSAGDSESSYKNFQDDVEETKINVT